VADWQRYLATYSSADIEATWKAVTDMCRFFEEVALHVAHELGYTYNLTEGQNSFSFLQHVRQLPKDAEGVY
ncbi:MAG: aminoglycoside 6-adenylyltransferase, partial [Firmicutes bacterium]|nr:aminoglycoside 6-adenylyltransferase [Bacillota bacterium]